MPLNRTQRMGTAAAMGDPTLGMSPRGMPTLQPTVLLVGGRTQKDSEKREFIGAGREVRATSFGFRARGSASRLLADRNGWTHARDYVQRVHAGRTFWQR